MNINSKPQVPGIKTFTETPCGGSIVSMVNFNGILVLATTKNRTYQLNEKGVFTPIMFEIKEG